MKTAFSALLAGVLAFSSANFVRADEPAKPATPSVPVKAEAAPLTDEALAEMLDKMGYEYKVEKLPNGVIYSLTVSRSNYNYVFDISLSPSKTKLWFSGWLSTLPTDGKVESERLLALLEASWSNGPAHFRYHRPFNQLNLGQCHDNRGITAAVLRQQIETFLDTMKKTDHLWNVKNWKKEEEKPAKPMGTVMK